ncbi:DUF2218 domain-containing protein [Actinomadura harenae]|uniref:DUF2218 domain-containing protein n=1 Tax=Actinomadura harenae TaxID=2483351 RepID=A0A3M2M997_9ACTN|nr:DUF2218 domain-containing protein [Actinomadura harenae]RMI45453.1 DUF2218 domain-containing protein [Actinomadura harenae]
MPVLEAAVETDRASRYLVQFCKHAEKMGSGGHMPKTHSRAGVSRDDVQVSARWSDDGGTVTFVPWGTCTLTAGPGTLGLRVEADTEDGLRRIQDIVSRDLERFSRRAPLALVWRRPDDPRIDQHDPDDRTVRPAGHRRGRAPAIVLAVGVIAVAALHLGLAGAIGAGSHWTGTATNVVVGLVVVKVALIAAGHFRLRHRRAAGRS